MKTNPDRLRSCPPNLPPNLPQKPLQLHGLFPMPLVGMPLAPFKKARNCFHLDYHQHQHFCNTKKLLRGINFVKITKIFFPESGHSCLVFVQYPRDSPRSAWELQKKSVPQRIPIKIAKKYKQKPEGINL